MNVAGPFMIFAAVAVLIILVGRAQHRRESSEN